jgi:L-amino acid N-acyltransferase YncA
MDSVVIRPAQLTDAKPMVVLLNSIIATKQFTILEPVTVNQQLEFIRTFPPTGVFLVAEENGQLLGLQDVSPTSICGVGEIGSFVALSAQRRGVGKALAQATFASARAKGFRKLMAMIRADNSRAIGFYGSLGFRVVGKLEQHVLAHGVLHDEILAELLL